jgi:hypothetical protein
LRLVPLHNLIDTANHLHHLFVCDNVLVSALGLFTLILSVHLLCHHNRSSAVISMLL